jgi:hypothetical protein
MVTMGIFPFEKNPRGRTGNRTRDLMISSQKLWPLDHEAGHPTRVINVEIGKRSLITLPHRVRHLLLISWRSSLFLCKGLWKSIPSSIQTLKKGVENVSELFKRRSVSMLFHCSDFSNIVRLPRGIVYPQCRIFPKSVKKFGNSW